MTNFIPIFPLGIVAYPGEQLNLHIFEPRYRQLIKDCFETKKNFGIPSVINGEISELGTLMEIEEMSKVYDDGEMDIKTRGIKVFKILEIVEALPEKLYMGAIVTYPENSLNDGNKILMNKLLEGIRTIHKQLNVKKDFSRPDDELNSYDIAHHAAMSMEEEYLLLEYTKELHRQEYLKRHINKLLPLLDEMEALRKKIKLNGHFKNLEGFNNS